MAVESTQMADLNKMVAPKPAASVLPGKVRRPVPENFKGCKCPTWRCKNGNCPCYAASYPCTWKCECQGCKNIHGTRGSDSNTGPGSWCKCTFSKCLNKNCQCMKGSHGCTSKCECEDCRNPKGVRGSGSSTEPGQGGMGGVSNVPDETTPPPNTEPEQADDSSGMAREAPQMEEQPRVDRNFDLNELPSSSDEALA